MHEDLKLFVKFKNPKKFSENVVIKVRKPKKGSILEINKENLH